MPTTAAARRYARALFQIAREDRRVGEVLGELDTLATMLDENESLRDALLTPLHPVEERKAVMKSVSQGSGEESILLNSVSIPRIDSSLISFKYFSSCSLFFIKIISLIVLLYFINYL